MKSFNKEQIEHAVRLILDVIEEKPNREGLTDTPKCEEPTDTKRLSKTKGF